MRSGNDLPNNGKVVALHFRRRLTQMTCCGDSVFFGCYGNEQVERNSDRYLGQVTRRLTDGG